jgi:hypothetical protein
VHAVRSRTKYVQEGPGALSSWAQRRIYALCLRRESLCVASNESHLYNDDGWPTFAFFAKLGHPRQFANYSAFLLLVLLTLGVIGANMQCKLPVALQLEVAHHFIEGFASRRARSVEDPATLGATKTPKTPLFNPYQLPTHGPLCRCALTTNRLPSSDETFYCLIAAENRHPSLGVAKNVQKRMGEVYMRSFGWSVGHPTHTWQSLFVKTFDFGTLV